MRDLAARLSVAGNDRVLSHLLHGVADLRSEGPARRDRGDAQEEGFDAGGEADEAGGDGHADGANGDDDAPGLIRRGGGGGGDEEEGELTNLADEESSAKRASGVEPRPACEGEDEDDLPHGTPDQKTDEEGDIVPYDAEVKEDADAHEEGGGKEVTEGHKLVQGPRSVDGLRGGDARQESAEGEREAHCEGADGDAGRESKGRHEEELA